MLDLDYHAELRERREHVAQAGYADALVAEGKRGAVEREHPARVGGRELGVGHLADDAGASAVALEMVVVADDDFAVARHVEVEFEILNSGGDGGSERLERVFGMRAGGTAMAKDAGRGGGEEVGVEMLAHFSFLGSASV